MIAGLYKQFDCWSEKGAVWLYSDPHFGDEDIIAGVDSRPDDEAQLKMINSQMGKNDTWICLGDVGDIEFVKRVRAGRKVLIMGNHDLGASNYERKIIKCLFDKTSYSKQEALSEVKVKYPNCVYAISEEYDVQHEPFEIWAIYVDNRLFDEIYSGPVMISEKIILSHEPIPNINWALNIHGHDHAGHSNRDKYHYNVCADIIGYKCVNFNKFIKEGHLSPINNIHRLIIDDASARAKKRGYSLKNKKR